MIGRYLGSVSYSCLKFLLSSHSLSHVSISESGGKVDVIGHLNEKIPVSVWLRQIRSKDTQRCVVVLEPVERLSASVSFTVDVSVFLMIQRDCESLCVSGRCLKGSRHRSLVVNMECVHGRAWNQGCACRTCAWISGVAHLDVFDNPLKNTLCLLRGHLTLQQSLFGRGLMIWGMGALVKGSSCWGTVLWGALDTSASLLGKGPGSLHSDMGILFYAVSAFTEWVVSTKGLQNEISFHCLDNCRNHCQSIEWTVAKMLKF